MVWVGWSLGFRPLVIVLAPLEQAKGSPAPRPRRICSLSVVAKRPRPPFVAPWVTLLRFRKVPHTWDPQATLAGRLAVPYGAKCPRSHATCESHNRQLPQSVRSPPVFWTTRADGD